MMALPVLALLVACLPLCAKDFFPASNWMKSGVLGLDLTNRDMTHFDLARFADQCADMGVSFVCCGTGQNSGYYNAPNPVYENIAGYPVGSKCDPADVPARFLAELAPRGMRMFLYIPCNPPEADQQARNNFLWPGSGYVTPGWATQNLWTQALQGWSDHYGPALAGWWFDGAYSTGAYDFTNLYGPRTTSGNANRMICFNNGPGVRRVSGVETMTAGEMNSMHLLPRSRWVSGAQWFTYTYAGDSWNGPMSGHYSQQFITDYLGGLRERSGVMMLNVQVDDFGNIDPPAYARLVEARKALRDKNANRRVLRNSTGLSGAVFGGDGWQHATGRNSGYWLPGYSAFVRRASLNEDTMKTNVNGAWAEYTFQGTGVSYFGDRGSDKGEVDVYLDGVFQHRVNCGGAEQWLQHLWNVTGLPQGTHQLKLVKVSGSSLEVDAFAVENPVADPAVIPPFQMSARASSEQPGGGEAALVLDDDTTTIWHNLYNSPTTLPQSITLGLGGLYPVNKLRYLPRRAGGNGIITGWQIATSLDGSAFIEALTGSWTDDVSEKAAIFPTVLARYVRLTATAGVNGFASAAEIRIEKDLAAVDPLVIDPATISVTASSEQTDGGSCFLAADGDPATNWRMRGGTVSDALPQLVLFDLVEVTDVRRLRYLPPQQGAEGIITAWTLSASIDGKAFAQVAVGVWAADAAPKTIDFASRAARFLKLEITAGEGDKAAAAEFTIERTPTPTLLCPEHLEIPMNTASHSFVATVGDPVLAPESLVLTAVSSDPLLFPPGSIVLGGSGASRTVTVTPTPYRHGLATLTLTVDNGQFTSTAQCEVVVLPVPPAPTTAGIVREATELWYDFNNTNKNAREALTTDASGNNRTMTGYSDPGNKWGREGDIIISDGAAGWAPANASGMPADNYQMTMQVTEPLPDWPSPHGNMDIANFDGIRIGYDSATAYTAMVNGTLLTSQPGAGLWLKLVKLGGNLSFLTSSDGQSWTPSGTEIRSDAGSSWEGLHLFKRPGGGYDYWGYFGDFRVDRISLRQTWLNQSGNRLWSPWVHNWSGSEWGYWKNSFATDALFGPSGAGPVTVTEPLRVRDLSFTAPGYEISGETLLTQETAILTAADATIRNAIEGTGPLTKSGTGTLTLAGAITCSGDIAVAEGSLVLASGASLNLVLTAFGHNRVTGSGAAQFHGAFIIDTSALSSPAAGSHWQLVDTASRSFGPTFQVEGFTSLGDGIHWLKPAASLNQWVFSESTGTLTLEISDYATWATSAAVTNAEADDDQDGMCNFGEYAFALDPKSGASSHPVTLAANPSVSLRYTRRNPALTRLTYSLWYSATLTDWHRDSGAGQSVSATDGDVQTVDVTPSPELLSEPKLFLQIRAE